MILLTNGDSFTYGTELTDNNLAWPYVLADIIGYDCVNLAQPGASNDYIVRSTVEYLNTTTPDLCIIAWTTPDRIEISTDHCTPNTHPGIFKQWDADWARSKYNTQVKLLESYFKIPFFNIFFIFK